MRRRSMSSLFYLISRDHAAVKVSRHEIHDSMNLLAGTRPMMTSENTVDRPQWRSQHMKTYSSVLLPIMLTYSTILTTSMTSTFRSPGLQVQCWAP